MNKLQASLVASLIVVSVGCNESRNPGGPGVTSTPNSNQQTANRPTYSEAERTFELNVPVLSTRLVQGETKTATISISRGKNFDEDVTLKMSDLPTGITVDPSTPTIKHGDKEVALSIHAASDAAIGDFTVKLMGHPSHGADATNNLKLTIVEK